MIAVIDYGAGNIRSVYKALKHIGCECVITRDKDEIMMQTVLFCRVSVRLAIQWTQ